MQKFTVYILFSAILDKYYIGYTSQSIQQRLSHHFASHRGFTAKAKDWIVVYTEIFLTKQEAMNKEKQLKGWKSNIRIRELIERSSTE